MKTPNGTKHPSKTNAYGKRTRYEIATTSDDGRSYILPSDQRTRGGVQWAYDTREAAQAMCAKLNEARAAKLVKHNHVVVAPSPHWYESQVAALIEKGEYLAAAIAYERARSASVGHTRRAEYEKCAIHFRELDIQRYNEAYPS